MSETLVDIELIKRLEKEAADKVVAPFSTYNHRVEIISATLIIDKFEMLETQDPLVEEQVKLIGINCTSQNILRHAKFGYRVDRSSSWSISSEVSFGFEVEVQIGGEATGGSVKSKVSTGFKLSGSKTGSTTDSVTIEVDDEVTIPPGKETLMKTWIARTPVRGQAIGKVRVVYSHVYAIDFPWYVGDQDSVKVKTFRDFDVTFTFEAQQVTGTSQAFERNAKCEKPPEFSWREGDSLLHPLHWGARTPLATTLASNLGESTTAAPVDIALAAGPRGEPLTVSGASALLAARVELLETRRRKELESKGAASAKPGDVRASIGTAFSTESAESLDALLANAMRALLLRGLSVGQPLAPHATAGRSDAGVSVTGSPSAPEAVSNSHNIDIE